MNRQAVLFLVGFVLVIDMGVALILRAANVPWSKVLVVAGVSSAAIPLIIAAAVFGQRMQSNPPWVERMQRPGAAAMMLLGMAVLMLLVATGLSLVTGGSLLVKLVQSVQHTAFFVGAAIASLGLRRVGQGRFCRNCGYEMDPHIAESPGYEKCPECASNWKGALGTVRGKRDLRPRWIVAGVLAGVLLSAWPFVMLKAPGVGRAMFSVMPTASLMAEATAGNFRSSEDAVTVLQARGMTPVQEERLARMLLDRQKRKGYIGQGPRDWLTLKEASGTLSPELSRRWREEHPYPALIPGDRMRLGLPAAPTAGP